MLDDLERLFGLVMDVGERREASGVGLLYLFAQTDDNRYSVAAPAVSSAVSPVGVCGRQRTHGYSGLESWLSYLVDSGLDEGRIVAVGAMDPGPLNTLTESASLVSHCMRSGVRRVAVMAPRWHITRCVMSVAGEIGRARADLSVVPWIGDPVPWDEFADHSQGSLRARRSDLLLYETSRIIRYVEKRDIPEPGLVLETLRHLR